MASLLATTSKVAPALAADKSRNGYGRGLKLEDVTGSASITIQKGKYYKEKHKDLKFYGDIIILKFIFFKGYVIVEGIIDGDIKNKWQRVVYEVNNVTGHEARPHPPRGTALPFVREVRRMRLPCLFPRAWSDGPPPTTTSPAVS
jgi:hypothetical protein